MTDKEWLKRFRSLNRLRSEGEERKKAGMFQREMNDAEWHETAKGHFRTFIMGTQPGEEFTMDDVRMYLEGCECPPAPHPNSWGALLGGLAGRGYEDTGRVEKSRRPDAHARKITVWRRK